jgi:hypothetical protein
MLALVFALAISFIMYLNEKAKALMYESKYNAIMVVSDSIEVAESIAFMDSVKVYINSLNVAYPDIMFQQAVLESGGFRSRLCVEQNNLFGMTAVQRRPTTAIRYINGWAVYETWQMSVIDRVLLDVWSYKGLSRDEYLKRLNRDYAEADNYHLYINKDE